MPFRTVVVKTPAKLELELGYLVHRTIDNSIKVLIKEIHTLIIESTAVTITSALICELNKNRVKIILCDEKHNPSSEIIPYHSNVYCSKSVHDQVNWNKNTISLIWQMIVKEKITNQAKLLKKYNFTNEYSQLISFAKDVLPNDETNREGHAAKVYFNTIFGANFSRSSDNIINNFLNYGYTLILSQINREIVSLGYLTELGIHHTNVMNPFNLSCDLMEPFRAIVDAKAKLLSDKDDYKKELINLLNCSVKIDGKTQTLVNAIKIYITSVLTSLSDNNINKIIFFEDYEV